MQRKIAIFLSVLMFIFCLPVPAVAMSASEEVTIQTEIFSGFDITIPGSLAEKYRWSEGGYEGANWIHFYDRSQFDASGGKSSYEEADEEKGYLFSIRQYYYDGDYRYGMGDLMFYELFQQTRNEIVAFYSRDDLSRLMILSVEYADSAPVSVQIEALKIAGYMTPNTDIYLEDVDANPWNLKFANFLLNGRFRNMGQEYFDDAEIQACLYNVAGDDYPELIITNGAADGQSSQAYIYTFRENQQVEYLHTATTEELDAMPLQSFTAIRQGWGDFLKACGYQIKYLPAQISSTDWIGTYRYDDGDQGELYIIKESDTSEVRGVYVFRRADGGYESRDFVWSKENSTTASEPFQNGIDSIYYHLENNRIVVDYPDGWWPDRAYEWVSDVDGADEYMPGILVSYAGASVKFRNSLFEKSAYVYDNELATLGAMLCMAAGRGEQEICQLFYQLGIEDANIENFNYGGENAFSIAHLPIRLNGEEMNLIFIVVRGSVVKREFIGDHFAKANREFLGYMAYDYVEDFEKKVWGAVKAYANAHEDLYDKSRAFFITGHSLGGATANLITALANNPETGNSWIFMDTDVSHVFTYTYGAIDSIKVDAPVTIGYQNIHNIYNFFDTYGPNGRDTLSAAGNSMYGKFGHIDKFAYRFSWENDLATSKNHIIDNYLRAIVEGAVSCESPYSYWEGDCPIDVEVLKDGAVVGRIVDNQVDEELLATHPEVALMVVEDYKRVGVFDNPEAYSLRITATDDGEMSVSTMSFDDTGESYGAAEYPNVAIKNGQVFSMNLPAPNREESGEQTPELLVMDGDRIGGKVNADGSISPVKTAGNGLQLALLIAIAAIGGLIVFLGGRNMNETKKIKFPVAAIFCTANVLLGLISIFMTYASLPHMPWNRLLNTLLLPILSLISGIVLAVVLYQRKRRLTLFLALGLELVILLLCICDIVFSRSLWGPAWKDLLLGQAIAAVIALLLLLFAAFQDWKGKSGIAKFNRAIWFVPGILYLVNNLSNLHQGYLAIINHAPGHDKYMLSMFSILAVGLPMTFLLGWWLTHPYKKERAVYQMPVAQPYGQPYGQPVYQSAGASNVAQKVFCTNCGRELLPDETFCVNCGTRRPELPWAEPGHAEQKVFCTGCGRELLPDEDFCGACGTKRPVDKTSGHTVYGGHIDL